MAENRRITWNRPKLERFRNAIKDAEILQTEVFIFEGNEFFIGYARHLIVYLEEELS